MAGLLDTLAVMALSYRVNRLLTRPRAFFRAWRGIGLAAALNLVRIRLGSREKVYKVRVPQWSHPVFVRGGDSTDAVVLYEILVTDEYSHIGDLGSPKFIIDGGANVGFASLHFLHRYPAAKIVAVEPDPKTMELCRKNLAPFSARVTIIQGAVWNRAGRISLEPQREEWTTSVRNAEEGEDASIEAFTVPWLISAGGGGPVDLLKLDVEGAEREIFEPDSVQWLPSVRNIVIELHGPDCKARFLSAMEAFQCEISSRDAVYFCANLHPVSAKPNPASMTDA
jgi:FkbM family methyltransferase